MNGAAARGLQDPDFAFDSALLAEAVAALAPLPEAAPPAPGVPPPLGESGIGARRALEAAAPFVVGAAARLGAPGALAHMDPPAPLVAWAGALWNAALNQNLLHPDASPAARVVEAQLVSWLAPFFGMDGGHVTAGSTLANLTALWVARDLGGVRSVVASEAAHVSIATAARILGLRHHAAPILESGRLDPAALPELSEAALVLTAGTTACGAIDPLELAATARWTHVDAAWAGPLRLSDAHRSLLDGLERADSVAISAHKLLFQPKGSAIVLFRDSAAAGRVIAAEAAYLSSPNAGLLGSRPAAAVPLYLTLLAWGRAGLAARLDRCLANAEALARWIETQPSLVLFDRPVSGVVLWRPRHAATERLAARLPRGSASLTRHLGESWVRNVAANPLADVEAVTAAIAAALAGI